MTGPTCCFWAAHHRPLQTIYCCIPKHYAQDQSHNFLVQFHCKDKNSITNKTQTYSVIKSITIANQCLQIPKNGPQSFYWNVLCMLSVVVDKICLFHPTLTIWLLYTTHFMRLWIIQIYRNYQQPFYPVTIHQRHTFWLLICIIQSLSPVTVCIIPGNICLTILYLYYLPSPSCYCCYLYLSGHFCLIFNFSTALLLALPLFSSQHKKTAHICILACFNAAVLSQYTMATCYTSNWKFSITEYLHT